MAKNRRRVQNGRILSNISEVLISFAIPRVLRDASLAGLLIAYSYRPVSVYVLVLLPILMLLSFIMDPGFDETKQEYYWWYTFIPIKADRLFLPLKLGTFHLFFININNPPRNIPVVLLLFIARILLDITYERKRRRSYK